MAKGVVKRLAHFIDPDILVNTRLEQKIVDINIGFRT